MKLLAYGSGHIDSENTGEALRYGYEVEEFFTTDAMELFNEFVFPEGNHGVASTNGETAYLAE